MNCFFTTILIRQGPEQVFLDCRIRIRVFWTVGSGSVFFLEGRTRVISLLIRKPKVPFSLSDSALSISDPLIIFLVNLFCYAERDVCVSGTLYII